MNEFEPAEKTLCFKVWIEFLYKIGHISQAVIWTLSYLILPILFGLYYVVQGILLIPNYISETQIYCALSGKNYKSKPFDYYQDYKSVIQHKSEDFSEEFKDLVFKMLSYNMLERPSLEQIKEHKWLQGPTPNQDQVRQAMQRLKSKFIEKEVEHHSTQLRMKNENIRNRPLPKSFKDYALFCIRTNNVEALVKGLYKLTKIFLFSYARWLLRCHYCRKKKNVKWIQNIDTKHEKYRKQRF